MKEANPDWKAIQKFMESEQDNCYPTLSQAAEKFDIKFQYIMARMRKEKWNCPQYKKAIEEKNGRPEVEIDKIEFEDLCKDQCTLAEAASYFKVDQNSLNAWCKKTYDGKTFSDVFEEKRQYGFISLRRAGFKLAEKNPAVHIFYCKNFLGMSDNPNEQNQNITITPEQLAEIFISQINKIPITDKDGNPINKLESEETE